MKFNPGDRIVYQGFNGTIGDWNNPVPEFITIFNKRDIEDFESGRYFPVLFDDERYRSGGYSPYWLVVPGDCSLISSAPSCAQKVGDLKFYNTQPGRTTCHSCSGKLKDLGMGDRFKFCPTCEP